MIRKEELEEAIRTCENAPASYQTCEKLATFYTLYDHLFQDCEQPQKEKSVQEGKIRTSEKSDFLRTVDGMALSDLLQIMDELMETIKILHPRLYGTAMQKITDRR